MRQRTGACRILAFLLMTAIISIGMYLPNTGVDSFSSNSESSDTLANKSNRLSSVDAAPVIFGDRAQVSSANISSGTKDVVSSRNFPFTLFLSSAIQPLFPLFIWSTFYVLLRTGFVDRLYLILFMHRSDGKKGDRHRLLLA